ncbi:MAG: sporulation transcriptional regulator SpoIIID [Clostridia bacterium]|nr:sporulation transcriptional regulator SpoIIID [Clostridia bacterium]
MLKNKCTIRQAAIHFGVGKSTLHNYVSHKLVKTNKRLHAKLSKLLAYNFSQKHIRGGLSTAQKCKKR